MVGINHPVFSHLDVPVGWEGATGEEKGHGNLGWVEGGPVATREAILVKSRSVKHPVCAAGCFPPTFVIHFLAPCALSKQLSEDTLFLENL